MRRTLPLVVLAVVIAATIPAAAAGDRAGRDKPTETLGKEGGYWYNESIDVNATDGLDHHELDALVARTMARVEHIRRLEFKRDVPVELVSRKLLRQRYNSTVSPALRTFDNAKFEALFLVNETADSIAIQERNAGSAIQGYYSPKRDAIVIVTDDGVARRIDELTLAHELVHALQDQHFNLSSHEAGTRDGRNALNGLIEGDATLVEYKYRQRCQGDWAGTCIRTESSSEVANLGVYFVKYQPYSDGPAFLESLRNDGNWSAVNALYAEPPETSEVIIHPGQFREGWTNLSIDDPTNSSWERVKPSNRPSFGRLGEAALASMFVYPLYAEEGGDPIIEKREFLNIEDGELSTFDPFEYDQPYSNGWNGDRLHVYQNPQNETGYVWKIAWEDSEEAKEFYRGYRHLLGYWGANRIGPNTYRIPTGGFADVFHVEVENAKVTIVNAPNVSQLTALRPGLDKRNLTATMTMPNDGNGTANWSVTPPPGVRTTQPGFGIGVTVLAIALAVALLGWFRT